MIKSAWMREKLDSMEKLPLNQAAKEIGSFLAQSADINQVTKVEKPFLIERVGELKSSPDIPVTHQSKRHQFWGVIDGKEVVIEYYSDPLYCQDPDYFRRVYQDARDFYGGRATEFVDRKLGPALLGYDDETMTLIIERAAHDLSFYFSSTDKEETKHIIATSITLFKEIWESSREKNDQLPRYVSAFLVPEYFFLKGKRVEDYLKSSELIDLYQQTQQELKEYLRRLEPLPFERGFGFPDVKPSNLIEDKEGNILFIDIAKPECAYHWFSQLGQFYQGTVKEAPDSLFTKTLKAQSEEAIKSFPQPELAIGLFALGRMNRLLISCTLRNIVYNTEIGQPVDEKEIRENLIKIKDLMKTTSVNGVMK